MLKGMRYFQDCKILISQVSQKGKNKKNKSLALNHNKMKIIQAGFRILLTHLRMNKIR